VKLLRVIQERQLDVVGDPHPRPVDVRILAATNQDLRKSMEQGKSRDDLYYRLSVAPLHLPPLRERPEDIPVLAHHFLEKINRKFGKDVRLETGALEALQEHDWPGNVRELENIVERQVVFDRRGTITKEDLPSHLRNRVRSVGKVIVQLPDDGFSLEEVERDLLLSALRRHRWNQTRAARYLDITRNTLVYRMHKYKLSEANGH
jgi:transcriptional regulator with PAS, ATPase and Fis domain